MGVEGAHFLCGAQYCPRMSVMVIGEENVLWIVGIGMGIGMSIQG